MKLLRSFSHQTVIVDIASLFLFCNTKYDKRVFGLRQKHCSVLQVGQWDCKDRLRFLEDEYLFRCQCIGCSKVNLSDLVLNAFHCVKPNCSGVVLDSHVLNCEKQKIKRSPSIASTSSLGTYLQVFDVLYNAFKEVFRCTLMWTLRILPTILNQKISLNPKVYDVRFIERVVVWSSLSTICIV